MQSPQDPSATTRLSGSKGGSESVLDLLTRVGDRAVKETMATARLLEKQYPKKKGRLQPQPGPEGSVKWNRPPMGKRTLEQARAYGLCEDLPPVTLTPEELRRQFSERNQIGSNSRHRDYLSQGGSSTA